MCTEIDFKTATENNTEMSSFDTANKSFEKRQHGVNNTPSSSLPLTLRHLSCDNPAKHSFMQLSKKHHNPTIHELKFAVPDKGNDRDVCLMCKFVRRALILL